MTFRTGISSSTTSSSGRVTDRLVDRYCHCGDPAPWARDLGDPRTSRKWRRDSSSVHGRDIGHVSKNHARTSHSEQAAARAIRQQVCAVVTAYCAPLCVIAHVAPRSVRTTPLRSARDPVAVILPLEADRHDTTDLGPHRRRRAGRARPDGRAGSRRSGCGRRRRRTRTKRSRRCGFTTTTWR